MRKFLLLLAAVIVSSCGGGGGGSSTGSNDVLSAYVSEFRYASSSTVYKPWESGELVPTVKYLKPNSELLFSLNYPSAGVSVNAQSGKVTFADNFFGGCVPVQLNWARTGESLTADACMDKEYLQFASGISKLTGGNSFDSVNGIWRYTISKADPATISFDVSLAYYDRARNETNLSGGVFPDGSTTTCSVIDGNLPVLASFSRKSQSPTVLFHDLNIDWPSVPVGEYQYLVQCTISSGQQSAARSQTQILKVIQ